MGRLGKGNRAGSLIGHEPDNLASGFMFQQQVDRPVGSGFNVSDPGKTFQQSLGMGHAVAACRGYKPTAADF